MLIRQKERIMVRFQLCLAMNHLFGKDNVEHCATEKKCPENDLKEQQEKLYVTAVDLIYYYSIAPRIPPSPLGCLDAWML